MRTPEQRREFTRLLQEEEAVTPPEPQVRSKNEANPHADNLRSLLTRLEAPGMVDLPATAESFLDAALAWERRRIVSNPADRPATEPRTEAYPPYPFSRPTPTAAPKATEHDADPGPFDHDDLDWGLRCVKCDELITPDERRWRHG